MIFIQTFALVLSTLFIINTSTKSIVKDYDMYYFKKSCVEKVAYQKHVLYYKKDDETAKKTYNGIVTDAVTAKKIADAIWQSLYGDIIKNEHPYAAKVKNNSIWVVEGNTILEEAVYCNGVLTTDLVGVGGTAYIEIRISDGKILKVTHGK